MKKILYLVFTLILFVPIYVNAQTYTADGDYVTVDIPDGWYVFTRENYKNNSTLASLGISEDKMNTIFTSNNIYMDAFSSDAKLEFFIRKLSVGTPNNLNDYSDEELDQFGTGFISSLPATSYETYKTGDYTYLYLNFVDTTTGKTIYIDEYVTVVNGDCYVLQLQKTSGTYTSTELQANKTRVDGAVIKNDTPKSKEEKEKVETDTEEKNEDKNENKKDDKDLIYIISGAGCGVLVATVICVVNSKKNKNKDIVQ